MDDRLNHEQKMFSKTNWEFTKKIVEGNFESQVSPILTLDVFVVTIVLTKKQ